MTDRPTNWPTERRTDRVIGIFNNGLFFNEFYSSLNKLYKLINTDCIIFCNILLKAFNFFGYMVMVPLVCTVCAVFAVFLDIGWNKTVFGCVAFQLLPTKTRSLKFLAIGFGFDWCKMKLCTLRFPTKSFNAKKIILTGPFPSFWKEVSSY